MFKRRIKWLWMHIKHGFFILSVPLGLNCLVFAHASIYGSVAWWTYTIAGNLFLINAMNVVYKKIRSKES